VILSSHSARRRALIRHQRDRRRAGGRDCRRSDRGDQQQRSSRKRIAAAVRATARSRIGSAFAADECFHADPRRTAGPCQPGTDLYRVVIRLRPDQCGVVPRLPELQAAVPHGRADLGFGPRRDHFARSSAHSSSTSFRGRRDGERGRAPPEPPGPPAPRAATPLHCVEAGLPQSLSSRHAVRASLARTSPVGSVSSMPKVFPIWSSRRATLLWCRWSRSAAWRWEPVTQ
jgi:hypothetical protein